MGQSHHLTIRPSTCQPHSEVPSGLGCQALDLPLGFPCEQKGFISEGSTLFRRTDREGVLEAWTE